MISFDSLLAGVYKHNHEVMLSDAVTDLTTHLVTYGQEPFWVHPVARFESDSFRFLLRKGYVRRAGRFKDSSMFKIDSTGVRWLDKVTKNNHHRKS